MTWEVSTTSKEGLGTRKGSTLQAKGMLTEVFCQLRIERKCRRLKSSVTCVVELAREVRDNNRVLMKEDMY